MTQATRNPDNSIRPEGVVGRRRVWRALLALLIGLAIVLPGAAPQAARANGEIITRCEPESSWWFTDELASVCIYVQDIPADIGLYGVDVELSFPQIVGVANITDAGQNLSTQMVRNTTWIASNWTLFENTVDDTTGYGRYIVYGRNPAVAVVGSGPVACLYFKAITAGRFDIEFTLHDLSSRDGWLMDNTAHTCTVEFVSPTSVEITHLDAQAGSEGIHVQWQTAQENDTVGFNVYRSQSATGHKTRLNPEIIPSEVAPGSPFGATYDWVDTSKLRLGRTYYYWVEEVNTSGHTTLHGPARLNMGRTID